MGRTMQVHGAKGAILFTQERLNELHLYRTNGPRRRRGSRLIEAGPERPSCQRLSPVPGHQFGFNDLKAIEGAGLERASRRWWRRSTRRAL